MKYLVASIGYYDINGFLSRKDGKWTTADSISEAHLFDNESEEALYALGDIVMTLGEAHALVTSKGEP